MNQAALPLTFADLAPPGRPDPEAAALHRRAGVEYRELRVRDVLNRCTGTRLPFDWSLNPYRGCELGCSYCYARYTHDFLDLGHWRDFERKIFVKHGAARALERRLKKSVRPGQTLALGTVTDPYQPAELRHRVTRELLETLARFEGLSLSIATKSPLILRDLDLLAHLDRRHAVTVQVTITTLDPELARRMETRAPSPQARLDAVARLAAAGIATSIWCMPLLPGINAGSRQLLPLFEAARERGVFDLEAAPLVLRSTARARFWPWLRAEFPHLVPRYRKLYGGRSHLRRADSRRLTSIFRRLRLEMGFPRPVPGR